jgi:hypothetical protein
MRRGRWGRVSMRMLRAAPTTGRHLPLDGGGWEGVREPRYAG